MSILINDGQEKRDILKCDIGELVLSVEKLKEQVVPFVKAVRNIQSILKWERPFVTMVVMVILCYVVLLNPVYMVLLCISPFIPIMFFGLLRCIGASKVPSKTYSDFFVRKDNEHIQEVFCQEEKRKHLNMYLTLLVQLQKTCVEVNGLFDWLYSIIFWREKKMSTFVLFLLSLLELVIYTFDMSTVLCVLILSIFLCNTYLLKSISDGKNKIKAYFGNVFNLKSSSYKHQHYEEISANEYVDSPRLPMVDREEDDASDTTSSSDSEAGEPVDMKVRSKDASKEIVHNESMMSKFLPRTWRRRNIENCSQCYQPVSSILKKRVFDLHSFLHSIL